MIADEIHVFPYYNKTVLFYATEKAKLTEEMDKIKQETEDLRKEKSRLEREIGFIAEKISEMKYSLEYLYEIGNKHEGGE